MVLIERQYPSDDKGRVFIWPGASQFRTYYHRMWGQLSTTCSNLLKQPNGKLPVAVNYNQLRTMASEKVDQIDWSHPPPSWAASPERHVHNTNPCNLSGNLTCNRSRGGNHLANAATQGINIYLVKIQHRNTIRITAFDILKLYYVSLFDIYS